MSDTLDSSRRNVAKYALIKVSAYYQINARLNLVLEIVMLVKSFCVWLLQHDAQSGEVRVG